MSESKVKGRVTRASSYHNNIGEPVQIRCEGLPGGKLYEAHVGVTVQRLVFTISVALSVGDAEAFVTALQASIVEAKAKPVAARSRSRSRRP